MAQLRPRTPTCGHRIRISLVTAIAAAALGLAAGCGNTQPPAEPAAQATIAALATANAELSAQVAALGGDSGAGGAAAPAGSPDAAASSTALGAALGIAPVVGDGPLPQALIAIELAPEGETLFDMRLDRATNHIFVTDSTGALHVVDATTYMPLKTLPYGGELELDSAHGRLYVYKPFVNEGEESVIHVFDTTTLEEVGTLAGRAIAIDSARNRLFVGEPFGISTAEDAPGVRIVDGATLEQTGSFTQTGAPVYNPQRDELLITAYTVYSADPKTQEVKADLLPELTDLGENGMRWCNGCTWVDSVHYYGDEALVAIDVSAHCAGKGCGAVTPPRFFDAATMEPIDPAAAPEVQADCGSQSSLASTVDGRRYVNTSHDRYVVFTNLLVTDAQGALLTLRDGFRIDYINPRTGQGYLYDGTVVDLRTLTPVGHWSAACLFTAEPQTGLLFGRRGSSLYVISERGAQPAPPDPALPEVLPQQWPIRQIAVSPDFTADSTLLAVSGAGIYRSTDAGQRWVRLQGDLPQGEGSNWIAAFSPTYASDRTIFAGGDRGEFWGEGVWRSQDGGATFKAQWTDLQHRRITGFHFAPDFDASRAMVTTAKFYDVATGVSGESYQQSLDGGITWTLAVTGSGDTTGGQVPLPPVSELLPGYAAPREPGARIAPDGRTVQARLEGGSWITAPLDLEEGDMVYALQPGPDFGADPTLFAFANKSLWRSADNGATWFRWDDARLQALDYTNQMTAAAVSGLMEDGSYRLVVGTANGQVWVLNPAQLAWAPVQVAAAGAEPPAGAQPSSPLAPAAPDTAVAAISPLPTATPLPVPSTTGAITPGVTALTGTPAATDTATDTGALTSKPLTGEPPEGFFRPEGSTGPIWQNNPRAQQDLGWARAATANTVDGAFQRFDNGTMLWREDTRQIYVFFNDGTWRSFTDTFTEGDLESDPTLAAPNGKLQPIRGFGKVWRENEDVRAQLGWATAKETAQRGDVHNFERGAILRFGPLLYITLGVDTDRGSWY